MYDTLSSITIRAKYYELHKYYIRPYAMRLLNLVSTPKKFCNEVVEYMLEEREDE
jgi:hypothetical protein